MKHLVAAILSAIAFATVAQNDKMTVSATASLRDGSSVKGEFHAPRIAGSTVFMEKLELNPAIVKSLIFSGTNGEAKVELLNGDAFAMTIVNESFAIKSILGELSIPRRNFRSIFLAARKTPPAGEQDGLLFYCTFDNEAAITSPAVGPKGTLCSREFTDGKFNKALYVPVGGSAGFFTLPPGMFTKEGCIEFWAKLAPRHEFYRDCDPRMILIRSPSGLFSVEYSSNNGGGRGGFFVRCFGLEYIKGGSAGGGYRYSDVVSDITAWHHYAFSWSEDSLEIFIDGVALSGGFKVRPGRINEEKLKSGPSIMGLPNDNTNLFNTEPNTPFTIDELKIWDHPRSEFFLQ